MHSRKPSEESNSRISACSAEAKSRSDTVSQFRWVPEILSRPPSSEARRSAAEVSWVSNWVWTWRLVRIPTIPAKLARMTNVSAAEPPASRQRIGTVLYAKYVPRAADRM